MAAKTTITRKLEFDYGHRVLGHEGKCACLHGHRGVAEITVSASSLDSLGRVIDFGEVKKIVGGWLDDNWDHNMILHPADPLLVEPLMYGERGSGAYLKSLIQTVGRQPFVMPEYAKNPTAENMAHVLWETAYTLLEPKGIEVLSVVLWETPNGRAEYRPE